MVHNVREGKIDACGEQSAAILVCALVKPGWSHINGREELNTFRLLVCALVVNDTR